MSLGKLSQGFGLFADTQTQAAKKAELFNEHNLKSFNDAARKIVGLINRKILSASQPFSGVLPAELAQKFHHVDLESPQDSLDHALAELESLYLNDAVYFHHPKYMAHLNTPVTNISVLSELIQASINTSVDTWDQSAGGTLIEQKLIDWTLSRIGFDPSIGDGIFTSGGTQSNLMAMLLARDNYCLEQLNGHSIQQHGLPQEAAKFRIFTSTISHFSIQKAAALLGLGFNAVVPVAVDSHYRMRVDALRQAVNTAKENGEIPIAVVATLGTTDFGSIDPIADMADLCERESLWLHADAAYGCGLLLSTKYREYLQGIALADSVTVDYHKSFFQPVACGAFFAKNKQHLSCLTYHADYLNPLSQTREGTPNLVCKSLQTTRRFDALKLWLTLRTVGPKTLGEAFDEVIDLAQHVYRSYCSDEDLEFIHRPAISALVFRFKPAGFNENSEYSRHILDQANITIRKTLSREAKALVASTKVNGSTFLKFTLLNPNTTLDDVSDVVRLIKKYGQAYMDEATHAEQEPLISGIATGMV